MSAGSREGGGNVLPFMRLANQNVKPSVEGPKEGRVLPLEKKRDKLRREAEMENQNFEDLAEIAFNTALAIKEYDEARHRIIRGKLEKLHSDRIVVLFKEIWCDPDKIAEDPTYAKAVIAAFSFRFSKANKK